MEHEKVIQTIKKVLALSKNNPSEGEAKMAAKKAQELLAKYHIDLAEIEGIDLDKVDEIDEVRVELQAKKWKYDLASIVADNFRCRHFYYGKSTLVFYGHKTDATIAAETFKELFNIGNICAGREVDKVFKETGTSAGVYNSYVLGFCHGLREALAEQCQALMLVVPEDVKTSFDERSKNFKNMKSAGLNTVYNKSCRDAYAHGVETGRSAMSRKKLEE